MAIIATAASLLFNSMAGYAFAKLRFRGRDRIFAFLVAALVIPAQVAMLPLFLLLKTMGLVNTYLGVLIPYMATISGIFLVRQFMVSIPDDLLAAARIDGASELRIYWRSSSRLRARCWPRWPSSLSCRPGTTSCGRSSSSPTTTATRCPWPSPTWSGEHVLDLELMMASAVLTVVPVLTLFFILQKQYIAGMMAGSVKG